MTYRFPDPIRILAAAALTCAGCAWHLKTKPAKPAAGPQPIYVGSISLVNDAQRFALIDNGNSPAPASGMALQSYTLQTRSGELTTSNVRRPPFVIADIRSGAPQKGDRVFYEPLKTGAGPNPAIPATPAPAKPAARSATLPERALPPHLPPPMLLGLPPSAADQ